ncbi:hypothetical protein VITU9109_24010 [Vibrio tubiashii ATCC 19109]|uniref:Uncharacterized protein n=1 Tax=Vibrio tubiashii ATCC 19109 TaxID=1051646 RepID=A0ABP2LFT9_9VIBR|nr:hypothetical protein VITU9109_24010 [Vibrio tubiashii ATCC 19109]
MSDEKKVALNNTESRIDTDWQAFRSPPLLAER